MIRPLPEPLEEVEGDVLVLFHFADAPVPRGALGRVDWLLSGAVSRLAVDGKFSGAPGSAALFHPAGKFRIQRILVLGLGPRRVLDPAALRAAAQHLKGLLESLRCRDVQVVLPELPELSPPEATEIFAAALSHAEARADASPTLTFLIPQQARVS